jgi:transcriptional regulator with PAS, ATPase and Fis domain
MDDHSCLDILDTPTIAASEAMRGVFRTAERAARLRAAVLVTGETGTGKEHVGRAIHHFSLQCGGPWVDVNCAAIPEHLMESELFGYEKGAFSGANAIKPGLMEMADRGTIFLDEIGELAATLQVKLLRVLDHAPYYRLGGVRKINPEVRVVAATNRDLEDLVQNGQFRRDLYYRLSQITIRVPPLRERKDDIIPLAELFLDQVSPGTRFTASALSLLVEQEWAGNARELRNAVIGALLEAEEGVIDRCHILLPKNASHVATPESAGMCGSSPTALAVVERTSILAALRHAGGNQKKAAAALGISPRTLYRKLKRYQSEERNETEPTISYA